jgi:hypothetical protein
VHHDRQRNRQTDRQSDRWSAFSTLTLIVIHANLTDRKMQEVGVGEWVGGGGQHTDILLNAYNL